MIYVRSLVGYLGEIGRGEADCCDCRREKMQSLSQKLVAIRKGRKTAAAVNGVWMTREVLELMYVYTRNPVSAPAAPDLLARPAGG